MSNGQNAKLPRTLQIAELWWARPTPLFLVLNAVVTVAAVLMPSPLYAILWRTPKYVSGREALSVLACCLSFAIGGFLLTIFSERADRPKSAEHALPPREMRLLFFLALGMTAVGYAAWISSAVSRDLSISEVTDVLAGTTGAVYSLKELYFVTIPGLSTMTQFGVAAAVLGGYITALYGRRHVGVWLLLLLVVTTARALFLSERLALLEVSIPFIFCLLAARKRSTRLGFIRRLQWRLAPCLALVAVGTLFGSFEYLRSWTNFYSTRRASYIEFVSLRFAGYYLTALNNGAFIADTYGDAVGPVYTAEWLYRLPIVNESFGVTRENVKQAVADHLALLSHGANPEFNNVSGVLSPYLDYGTLGLVIYWGLAGVVSAAAYRGYRLRSTGGLLLYPLIVLTLIDSPRILYWAMGRSSPAFAYLVFCWVLMVAARRKGSLQVAWA